MDAVGLSRFAIVGGKCRIDFWRDEDGAMDDVGECPMKNKSVSLYTVDDKFGPAWSGDILKVGCCLRDEPHHHETVMVVPRCRSVTSASE